jgi:hypothetical protein
MLSFAPLLVAAILLAPRVSTPALDPDTEVAVLDAPTRHIRTMDTPIRKLLKRGVRHSPSFAALVTRLQDSNVYVYIELMDRLPGALEGRLMMLPSAHGHRYVRVQIALHGSFDDMIALLGHELQHAVEVADAEEVIDQATMAKLYERIGSRGGEHLYDTVAAQEMGRTVRRELQG